MILNLPITFFASLVSLIWGGNEATLLFAGDAMMHKAQIDAARTDSETYNYDDCLADLADYISSADYAVVNLETPLGGKPYSGYPCFCAPDSYAEALRDAGFDMCLTANNHTLDRRDKGLKRTIEVLDELGIDHLGTYANASQREAVLPYIREVNGIKIGFLNYTYGTNGLTPTQKTVVDYIDKAQIKKDLQLTRDSGAELLCVAIHWGDEYVLLPNRTQRQLADFLVAEGVDMVIGGHPHVIQPMEMRTDESGKKSLVIYSLGNFLSAMKTTDTRGGAMAKVHISRGDDGVARVDSASYRLVFTVPSDGRSNFKVMDVDSVKVAPWKTHCQNFVNRAEAIFNKHNIYVPRRQAP